MGLYVSLCFFMNVMGLYRSLFVLMVSNGSLCVPIGSYAFLCVFNGPYVCLCVFIHSHGS